MTTFRAKPITLALLATFAAAQPAGYAATAEPQLKESIEVSPGRSITPADEQVLSDSAAQVLHHITRARDDLRKQDGEGAAKELKQAETLLDIIQKTAPTTVVKRHVSAGKDQPAYDNTEEVTADSVPIYATLDVRADFDLEKIHPAKKSEGQSSDAKGAKAKSDAKPEVQTAHATAAEKALAKKKGEREEPEATDAEIYYEELDLPLDSTRHFVAAAQVEIGKKRLNAAEHHLSAAIDGVSFVAVHLPAPLLAARINLEQAEHHFAGGQKSEAKADVDRAIAQLTQAQQAADEESQPEIRQLLDEAHGLNGRIDNNEPGLAGKIHQLWRRTEVHADRAAAYIDYGWNRLRHHDPLHHALIEARRYVAYADIEANVANAPEKARHDMEEAKRWLDQAAELASDQQKPDVASVQAKLEGLLNGKQTDKEGLVQLKQRITEAIDHS